MDWQQIMLRSDKTDAEFLGFTAMFSGAKNENRESLKNLSPLSRPVALDFCGTAPWTRRKSFGYCRVGRKFPTAVHLGTALLIVGTSFIMKILCAIHRQVMRYVGKLS